MKIIIWVALFFTFIQSGFAGGGRVLVLSNAVPNSINDIPFITNAVAVSAGLSDALALRDDGTVVAWGQNDSGITNVPSDVTNVVAISSGWFFHMALRGDGTVVTWGDTATQTPAGLSNVVAIAAGAHHCLALRSDGSVVGWGTNNSGQTNVPLDATNIIAVAAGLNHSLALRSNRTVIAWGDNSFGECNVPPGLSNVVAISAGWNQSLALSSDGEVVGWEEDILDPDALPTNAVVMATGWDLSQDFILRDGTMPLYGISNAIAAARGNFFTVAVVSSNNPSANSVQLSGLTWNNNRFSGAVSSRCNRIYRLEYRDHLTDAHWSYLGLSAGNGGMLRLGDATATVPQRFYRATRW